jgi:DNA-binding transcriptional LysR family regulator
LFPIGTSATLAAMDTLGAMALFVRAAEARSFSVAARQLRMTPSAVSRCVARLERELGARLLQRSTHAITLTEAGQLYYERAARVVADAQEARDAVAHAHRHPRGTLRIDAPLGVGRLVVGPLLPRFLARHPELRVELSLRDRIVDPIAEGIDVLVRVGASDEASLSSRKLGAGRMIVCGSPAYLRRRGTPRTVADLADHECLAFLRSSGRPRPWIFGDGSLQHVPRGRVASDNAELLRDAAVAGLGLACLLEFTVTRDLAAGAVKTVLADQMREERAVYALWPLHRQPPAKVRAFVDFLAEALTSR